MKSAALALTPVERDVSTPDGSAPSLRKDGYTKTPVTYLDYTVDGIRLIEHLGVTDVLDYVGVVQDGLSG